MKKLEIFADFETRNSDDNLKGIVEICTAKINNEPVVVFTNKVNNEHIVKQFLDWIVINKKKQMKKFNKHSINVVLVYFHNLAKYDSFFIIAYLLENNFKQRIINDDNQLNNNEFTLLASDSVKILGFTLRYENCTIYFRDSLRKIPFSIKKIGEFVNQKKLVDIGNKYYNKKFLELNEIQQNEYIEYAIKDVEIAENGFKKFTNFFIEVITKNNLAKNKVKNIDHIKNFTLPQAAKDLHKGVDFFSSNLYTIKIEDFNNFHYFGGYTICNPKYLNKIVENVSVYDINSSYPSIMLDYIPCEEIKEQLELLKIPNYQLEKLYEVYIFKAKLKDGFVPIIRKLNKKLVVDYEIEKVVNDLTNEKFYSEINDHIVPFYFWKCEFEYVKKFYDLEYKINKIQYFKKHRIFNRYINHFKQEKEQADFLRNTTDKNSDLYNFLTVKREFCKLLMNSLSGKFGQKIYNENWLTSPTPLKTGLHLIDEKLINIIKEKKPLSKNSFLYKYAELNEDLTRKTKSFVNNNYIVSYITARGRCKIFEVIEKIKDDFVYCDTDSIYCKNNNFDSSLINEFEFGKWKFEGNFKYFKCLKSKCYIASNYWNFKNIDWTDKQNLKITISGFKELTFLNELNNLNDFKIGLKSDEWSVKKGEEGGKVWEKKAKIL